MHWGSIAEAAADGLVLQVDGAICILGSGAARALKDSFPPEDRQEMFAAIEKDVKRLKPIPHGEARIVPGDGKWESLVIVAAVPHNVNDRLFSPAEYAAILRRAIQNAVTASVANGLKSIAMTTIGTSYRMPGELAVDSTIASLFACRRELLEVFWCFVDEHQYEHAQERCRQVGLPCRLAPTRNSVS